MKLRILDLAEADLVSGFNFYERPPNGIGNYFMETLYSDIESLHLYAGIHPKIFGYFRLLSHRFPFAVYYKLEDGEIHIWRILDCRRDPSWIEKQLGHERADR